MRVQLAANVLIETIEDDGSTRTERVLCVDHPRNRLVSLDVETAEAMPVWSELSGVRDALREGRTRVLHHDPWFAPPREESQLTKAERQGRDRAWSIIEPIVTAGPDEVFDRKARGCLVTRALERRFATKPTIYQYLRRYWRGGQSVHALIPRFKSSGAPGKVRTQTASASRKRGRPSFVRVHTGEATGINVDERVRQLLVKIGTEFYENGSGYTKKRAFEEGLRKYFHDGYDVLPDGTRFPVLLPEEWLPTYGQFEYWYGKSRDPNKVVAARVGQREYNLKHRPIRGDSTSMAFGPGSLYQVDATVGDVYLVSSRDPRLIIGRPVIYVAVDTFSRLVAGFTVGLEGPSWMGAALAFENVATDKVDFCSALGITITQDLWPVQHFPEAILGDRGELEGRNADSLVKGFGVRVANTPPYRADWKAIVERHFRLVNDRILRWLPGAVRKNARGDRDYRLDAAMTLAQLRKVLALCFLEHNQTTLIEDYPLDPDMRRDGVRPYPLELWSWGIEHRTGGLRHFPPDMVRRQLLPRAQATMRPRGLYYGKQYYTSELIEAENWSGRARQNDTWRVDIAYDPWSSARIWMELEGREDLILCERIPQKSAVGNVPWAELELEDALDELYRRREQGPRRQTRVRYDVQIEQVRQEAKDHLASAPATESKAQRLGNITANRREEKIIERRSVGQSPIGQMPETAPRQPEAAASDRSGIPMFDSDVSSDLDALVDEEREG